MMPKSSRSRLPLLDLPDQNTDHTILKSEGVAVP